MSTATNQIDAMTQLGVVVTAYATDHGQTVVQIDTSTDDEWVNPDGSPGRLTVMLNDAKLYDGVADLYVVDEGVQLDVTQAQADKLVKLGLIVKQEDTPNGYDATAFVWDDLSLHGDDAMALIEWALRVAA